MNLKNLFQKLGLVVALFVFMSATAFAQVYVSATNGDDTFGTGAQVTPYRSIQKAINSAATGSTIYVEAGVYNSTVIPTEGAPVTLAAAKSLTFVGTSVGGNTTVTVTDGFTLNHASAVADFQTVGTATFNFGSSATALVLTAGTMNIATASVTLGSGATMTVGDGLLNTKPTVGSNLSVTFNGANAVSSTAAYMPSSLGTGTLSVDKTTGAVTIDNATLGLTNLTLAGTNTVNVTVTGSLTVAANGDITQGGTGTLTIGSDASSTLTMSSTSAGVSQIIANAGGSVVVNSNVSYSVKNAGTAASGASSANYAAGNIFALTAASNLTVNGNITFNNTNVASTDGDNAEYNTVTLSNGGTGALSVVGTISTPLASTTFAHPDAGGTDATNKTYVYVILSNTSTGSFDVRTADTKGVAGTDGVINNAGGTMTLGQAGDTFSTSYDVNNDNTDSQLIINAVGTFGGAFKNNDTDAGGGEKVTFNANASIAGVLTNAVDIQINAYTITLSGTGAGRLVGAGDIYSTTSATVGSGWIKFTGAAPTSTYTGKLPNVEVASGTSITFAGNLIYGDFKVSGNGTVSLGASTISGNYIAGGSGAKTSTAAVTVDGDFNGTGSGTYTVTGGLLYVKGNFNMNSGSVTLNNDDLTVDGTFTMTSGTFTFGANTLTLKGDFNRTGGTIDNIAAGTGTLDFAGVHNQSFTPGTQMNVFNVTVNNLGNYIANVVDDNNVTINASLIVLRDFTITTGKVILGTSNIRMQQANLGAPAKSARFTNGGRGYTASGIGGIIFEGDGTNAAGTGDGAVITGAQPYSNIYVRLSTPANNVYALGAVKISGVVTLDGGGIVWNAATDVGDAFTASTLTLDDVLTVPTVVINTQNAHGSPFLVDGADGGAVALGITSVYNLTYTGQTSVTMGATDFISTKVKNLTLSAGTAGKTITFIAGNGTITGALTVDNGETLQLTNGGARTLTASSNTAAHVVNGTVTGGVFEITGNAATLTGGSGTGNLSSIAALTVDPATTGTFTSTGMKVLTTVIINKNGLVSNITMNSATATVGAFTNTAGTTTLNMNSTASTITGNVTVTAGSLNLTMNGAAAATATIAGALAVNGGTLTLGSHIWVTGAANSAGNIALGDYNLTLANNYTHTSTGTITAGTGAIVAAFNVGATVRTYTFTTTVNIPNFTLNAAGAGDGIQFVTNGLNITNKFVHTAGDLDLNSLPLTISGDTYTYTAGTYSNTGAAATGIVNLTGAALTITAAASPVYPFVNVNSTGTVTFASSSTTVPRSYTVSTAFTHTKGNIVLGFNDLLLTDDGAGTDATYTTVATAGTVTGTATGANLGEVVFGGANGNHAITMADNYSIQNVKVSSATTKGGTKVLTVGSNFTLGANFTFTNSARLVLGDGANIIRSAGVFDVVPTFGTTVNVNYTPAGALNSDVEIPVAATVLNNLTVTSGAPVLTANTTVNGTLFLVGGTISTGTKTLTIADGATINRSGGAFAGAATDVPTVTTYKLVYSGAGAITIGKEFVSSTTAVTSLTVSMTGAGVLLNADRTVGSFSMSPTGAGAANVYFAVGTDAATKTFTVTGPTTIDDGIVSTQDATAATSTDASSFVAKGSVTVNGGSFGTLGTDNGAGYDGGLNLTFGGAVAQSLTLNGNITIPNITLNSTGTTADDVVVNVTGGNLTITNLITFQNGILNMGSNTLYLPRPTGAANGGLAFDRTAVGVGEFGHVVGKVSRPANSGDGGAGTNGRFEFPVGTLTGEYRPAAINFTPNYVVNNPVNIEVNHIDTTPGGTVGLPLDGGNNVKIGNYTNFYWLVNTTPSSLSSTQNFDIDLQANNIGLPYTSDAQLRIVRRQDGAAETNAWSMQGTAANYANYQVVTGTDTVVVARTTSSQGGLVYQGSRFSIGVPTRAPSFLTPAVLAYTVNENTSTDIGVTATGNDVGETVTIAKVSGPTWATYTNGVLTLAPGYDVFVTGANTFNVVLRATDSGGATADLTLTVTVNNVNRAPSFTADGAVALTDKTVKAGSTLAGGVTAVDADGGDLTYTIAIDPALAGTISITAAATGAYEFAPVFADAGKDFNVTITVTDNGGLTATTTAKFTVDYPVALGDVDGNGSIGAADASEILKYVVGLVTFDAQQMYAANVNGDAEVGALDAAWVLYYVANGTWPSGAKMNAVAGLVDFGQIASENGVINMPINLTATSGVLSAYTEISINDQVEVTGVTARLPEGWTMVQNVANNKVRIAMAGLTPLTEGTYAVVGLKLKDKEAVVNISGLANLNDQLNASLSAKVREIPSEFALSQNYPNPFNPTTTIKFAVAEKAPVTLNIYNMLGQKVKSLVDSEQEAGFYTVNWDGTNDFGSRVASGIYIYRITAGKFTSTMKMNLLK